MTSKQTILFGLAKLRAAMMKQEVEESTSPKQIGHLATSYGCGQGKRDNFALTQSDYNGYYYEEKH